MSASRTGIWLAAALLCATATAVAFFYIDVPAANFFHGLGWSRAFRAPLLRLPLLIVVAGVAFVSAGIRGLRGRSYGAETETVILVMLSLALALCINEFVLKAAFARPTPHIFFRTGHFLFRQMRDIRRSSFPSGHAAQILAVTSVLWNRHPATRIVCVMAVFAAFAIMLLGGWHFVSDLIAGSFVGAFCAAMVMALWDSRPAASGQIGRKSL